jgi:hypothetical protein
MSQMKIATLAALALTLLFVPALDAGWVHQQNSVFQAKKASQKIPATISQTMVVTDSIADASVCIAFAHNADRSDKGKVTTTVTWEDADGNSKGTTKFRASVNGKSVLRCKEAPALAAGDVAIFTHQFRKMPRLRKSGNTAQGMAVAGVISTDGHVGLGSGPLALEPPGGKTPNGLVPGTDSGWYHSTNSVFQASQAGRDHPQSLSRVIVMPVDSGASPLLCAGYNRDAENAGDGAISTTAEIARAGGEIETLQLNANVKDGVAVACREASKKIKKGDVVGFTSTFAEMPSLDRGDFSDLVSAISMLGVPSFPIPRNNGGGGGGGGGVSGDDVGGGGKGTLSTADVAAAARLFSVRKTQLRRQKNNSPAWWVVLGPRTVPDPNRHGYPIYSTAGLGTTIAAAVADYEAKRGSLGGGSRRGRFHGDVYTPSLGVRGGGPFGSIAQTVSWFQSLGL